MSIESNGSVPKLTETQKHQSKKIVNYVPIFIVSRPDNDRTQEKRQV